jgi:AraC-like DNA-binding protein
LYNTPMNMTWDAKNMIARCIERMRRGACATCDNRDSCVFHQSAAARGFDFAPRPREPQQGGAAALARNPFLNFLGEMAKAFEGKAKAPRPSFRREVERRVEPMLASGDVGIDRVARELGLSRQTLYRRLKAEGVTFEQLLDGLRRRLALRLMREGLSVKEAAYRLGFSDPAAFSRAFKRWTGSSPSGMRDK